MLRLRGRPSMSAKGTKKERPIILTEAQRNLPPIKFWSNEELEPKPSSTHTALTKDEWRRSEHRVGMQNAGWSKPSVQDWGKAFPTHLCALATADQNTLPAPAHAKFEDAQLSRVPRNSLVLVISQHNLPEPYTDLGHAAMHPALKLNLDGFELRDHSLERILRVLRTSRSRGVNC